MFNDDYYKLYSSMIHCRTILIQFLHFYIYIRKNLFDVMRQWFKGVRLILFLNYYIQCLLEKKKNVIYIYKRYTMAKYTFLK
jgi:hypothetical protein